MSTPQLKANKAVRSKIPNDQWDLPISFDIEGDKFVTLREVADDKASAQSLSQLSSHQRMDLVVKRIESQPKFELAMIGAGVVDKARAISEVKASSSVGKTLMEIEQRLINYLLTEVGQTK